jgi:phosphoribosylformylglycinamidine synthase
VIIPSTKYRLDEPRDLSEELLTLLADQNVRSREDVIRTYDHEVMGCTAVKPLQGKESGPNDAAVIKPLKDSWTGLVISCGINPFYPDPYWMAANSIEEAVRNNTAVGGRRVAILDNFVWGNPEHEDRMGSLLRAVEACYDYSKALDVPFISGKDSLYNESPLGPVRPTLLITGVGIIPDLRRSITVDLKQAGDPIYLIGLTKDETGGSAYFRTKGITGGKCPKIDAKVSKKTMDTLIGSMDGGMVLACHDLSDGGLGVAAAEMVIASEEFGLNLDMGRVLSETNRNDILLFSESTSRFLVEVNRKHASDFESILKGLPYSKVGEVNGSRKSGLSLFDLHGKEWVLSSSEIRRAWRGY